MKKLILVALSLASLSAFAGEGSGGGNGGGGNGRGQSFGDIKLPKADAAKDARITELSKRLSEAGIANHDVRNDPSSILKILLGLKQDKSVHSAGAGETLDKKECPKEKRKDLVAPPVEVRDKFKYLNSKGEPLTVGDVCRSPQVTDGFGAFFEFLRAVYAEDAKLPAIKYAIGRTVEIKNAPIEIRFFKRGLKTKTKGGITVVENAWFDSEQGFIGIAPQTDYESGAQAMVSRGSVSLLIHELTHAYTAAVMGGYEKNHVWHDFSTALSKDKRLFDFRTAYARNAYDVQTDAYAAFVESFSNMVEPHGGMQMHPFVAEDPMVHFEHFGTPESYFSVIDQKYALSRDRLFANEAYVSTAWSVFNRRPFVNRDDLIDYAGITNYVHDDETVKIRLMKALEVAMQDRASANQPLLVRVLMKFDALSDGDRQEGWRFLREFYNYDYKTGRDIRNDFTRLSFSEHDKGVLQLGPGVDLTTKLATNALVPPLSLWTPYADQLMAKSLKEAEAVASQKFSAHVLLQEIDALLRETRESIAKTHLAWAKLKADMPARRAKYAEVMKSTKAEDRPDEFEDRIYSNIANLGQEIDISSIQVTLSSLRDGKTDDLYKPNQFGATLPLRQLAKLRMQVASNLSIDSSAPLHVQELKRFLELKRTLASKNWLRPVTIFESFDVETGR